MGTRAAFWVGDPVNLDNREWLGCIAWDGHPENFQELSALTTEGDFRAAVLSISAGRRDFASPQAGGWPFPWADDVFLTDVTYAFFDGAVYVCWFHQPFQTLMAYLTQDADREEDESTDDPRHIKVPAPAAYDTRQPDSIMVIRRSA